MDPADRARELVERANNIYRQATANMYAELETNGFFDLLDRIAAEHGDDLITEAECQALVGRITTDELDEVRESVATLRQNFSPSPEQVAQFQSMVDDVLRQAAEPPDTGETP